MTTASFYAPFYGNPVESVSDSMKKSFVNSYQYHILICKLLQQLPYSNADFQIVMKICYTSFSKFSFMLF